MGLGLDRTSFIDTFRNADIVEFSINASNAMDFKRTKGLEESDFIEISSRMKYLATMKCKTRILVSRVETKDKAKDDEFVNHWRSFNLFDDVFIRSFHDYGARIADKDMLLKDKQNIRLVQRACLVPTGRMNIDGVLGMVVRCFNELFDSPEAVIQKSIGNILEENSLKDIWEGGKMEKWRKNIFLYPACVKCRSCQQPNPNSSEKQLMS